MSSFVVSARKYRPTTFDEMVGQDHVAKTLKNALLTGQLAQAFLFAGPRGVGKTTSARILAKIINCENPIDKIAACNECSSCRAFNDNASFNFFELDAASNNSVDNIRSLIEQVRFQPQNGRYKIVILDEVHMLSTSAFNAFLKTLEEPPAHAIFILATTEKHKVLPTILSRCQIFDFKRITISDTVKQLEKICEKEGVTADEEALHVIANKADGAMRDALTIFDKLASATDKVITYKDVVANLNLLDYENYFKVTDAIMSQDLANTFLILDGIILSGFDPEHFLNGLADHCRDLLIAKNPTTISILDISDDLKRKYLQQAALASQTLLLSAISILAQCEVDLPVARNKRLHVELALSKLVYLPNSMKGDQIVLATQEKKTNVVNEMASSYRSDEPVKEEVVISEPIRAEVFDLIKEDIVISQPTKPESIDLSRLTNMPTPSVPSFGLAEIKNIRESIIKTEATKAEARMNLNLSLLQEIWNSYKDNNPSKSVQTALHHAKLSLENITLTIAVPNQVSKDMIVQETMLIDALRDKSGESRLLFNIVIDIDKFPEFEDIKPVQTLTQREKYSLYLEQNPDLGVLAQTFSLKFDNEI